MADTRSPRTKRRGALLGAVVATSALLLGACGQSKFQYVSNRDVGSYLKIPTAWPVEDVTARDAEGRVEEPPQGIDSIWHLAFSTGDTTSVDVKQLPTEVRGSVQVFSVRDYYRETFSISRLRASVFLGNIDPVYPEQDIDSRTNRLVGYQLLAEDDGLTGSRVIANLNLDTSGEEGSAAWVTQDVTLLFDNQEGMVYVLSMYCGGDCYERNQDEIDQVATSFTVRTDA